MHLHEGYRGAHVCMENTSRSMYYPHTRGLGPLGARA